MRGGLSNRCEDVLPSWGLSKRLVARRTAARAVDAAPGDPPCPKPSSSRPPARPIGRAFKGSLKDVRPDDLAATIVQRRPRQGARRSTRRTSTTSYLGCGRARRRARLQHGPRRRRARSACDHLPGATVNRYCSSSLQTTRMAFHAIKAGEGDVFISAGVETVSPLRRRAAPTAWPDTQNPLFAEAEARTRRDGRGRARRPGTTRARTACCPTSTSRWARPPRTSRGCAASPAQDMDEFGVRSARTAPRRPSPTASSSARSPRSPLPDGTVVSKDDGPRAGVTLEARRTA